MSDTASDTASAPKPRDVDASAFREELQATLAEYDHVLVDFYTKGCTLCQSIEPVLGSVARATGVPILLVNPQTDPSLASEHSIRSVPTLILFRAGSSDARPRNEPGAERPVSAGEDGSPEEVDRIAEGFVGAEAIVEFVEDAR